MMRLNKYIAYSGICSRRKAVDFIKAGDVKVNGVIEKNPAVEITDEDVVLFKEKILKPVKSFVYFIMNKPKRIITSLSDERDRKTVLDLMKNRTDKRIYPVGRLDYMTTGLLLLTNDGDLAQKLTHPKYNVKKIYHAVLDKPLKQEHFDAIVKGITLEDGPVSVDKLSYVKDKPKTDIGVDIHIGRNRIVRRIFEHFGYTVIALDRVYYAGLTKKDMPRGFSRPLTDKEVIMLKHFT